MLVRTLLKILVLLSVHVSAGAETAVVDRGDGEDICAPFKHRYIDAAAVQHMLDAASQGNLYRIEATASSIGFCVESPIGTIEGEFKRFRGGFTVENDPGVNQGQAMMVVDTGSMEVPGRLIRGLLEGENFFNSDEYPELLFVSTGFYWVNEKEAVLVGDLTIRDVTRSVGFHVELIDKAAHISQRSQRLRVMASTRIRRSEFGIISLAPMVSDDVTLCMLLDAVRYSS